MDEIRKDKKRLVKGRSADSSADTAASPSFHLVNGQIVGERYKVISLIGKGGMGSVYSVEQIFLHKEFALKTLNPGHMSDMAWRRFQKEAQATSALDHPSLIKVHDFGMIDDTQPFFVMDFFDGETLANRIERSGALPLADALSIFTHVCFALAHAHKQGVIHRDIKPSNIMISQIDDVEYQVRVVDFGIAKLINASDHETLALTRTGEVFGTPYYMSPEQCLGVGIDHRADIYSLGCVLFHALTGMPPFIGDTALSIMMQHQSTIPAALKEASLGKVFPEATDRVVRKMLQKKPEDRYQSLLEVASDLELIKLGQHVHSQKNSTLAKKPRNNLLPGIAALVVVSGLSFVGGRFSASQKVAPSEVPASFKAAAPVAAVLSSSPGALSPGSSSPGSSSSGSSGPTPSPEQINEAARRSSKSFSAISGYYSTFTDPKRRIFHFDNDDEKSPGILILPKSVECPIAVDTPYGKKVHAKGDVEISNFQPFAILVAENVETAPQLLTRFRADEVSELSLKNAVLPDGTSDAALSKCTNLKSINAVVITNSKFVTDKSLGYLNQLPNLTELGVSHTRVTGKGLTRLTRLKDLRVLDANSLVHESGGAVLEALAGSTKMQDLNLRRGGFGDSKMEALASLVNLRHLDLSSTEISDRTLKELSQLKHLTQLSLYDCPNVTDSSFEILAKFPALKALTIGCGKPGNKFPYGFSRLEKLIGGRCVLNFTRVQNSESQL
jgi:serine/threonine protein kinase